jgi:hypothetical protein
MVKYIHCEKCKKVCNTETWIGEVHTYNGLCSSCIEKEEQEDSSSEEKSEIGREEQLIADINITESTEQMEEIQESTQSSLIETEKSLLLNLEQRANEVLSSSGSIDVLIKEIKLGLVDKAKERIEEVFQSFDVNKIDAQKTVDLVEKTFEYLSEYEDYMSNVVLKLQANPKLKVKSAIEKVYKETMSNMPKDIAKDLILNKKEMLKNVYSKAVKWYNIHSDEKDALELTKKMALHPFSKIQEKLGTLPFYARK